MNFSFGCICRGDTKAYIQVNIRDCDQFEHFKVIITDNTDTNYPEDLFYPKDNYCQQLSTSRYNFSAVLTVPLTQVKYWNIKIIGIDKTGFAKECKKRLSNNTIKWLSRLNYRIFNNQCMQIRDIDTRPYLDRGFFQLLKVTKTDTKVISILKYDVPYIVDCDIELSFKDSNSNNLAVKIEKIEDSIYFDEFTDNQRRRCIVYSLETDSQSSIMYVYAKANSDSILSSYTVIGLKRNMFDLNPKQYNTSNNVKRDYYDLWFNLHKTDKTELDVQQNLKFEIQPLYSVVVPLYNTPKTYLREMIDSVINQSYQNWELILVNASPQNFKIKTTLSEYCDPRLQIIELSDNYGISDNTNSGIKAARGDFIALLDHDDCLESDALFEYTSAINNNPSCDFLYCDEDNIYEDKIYTTPFFKPDFSPELLQAQNYITHFLAIKTSLLDEIGLLNKEYDGAQDYDLILRASEAAKNIIHIQKILYHWRAHQNSTSGNADSKPYAQEAGRKAVEAHCKRCNINADALSTSRTFVYKVQHKLSSSQKVSAIIINQSDLDLLQICVNSIFNNAISKNLEIIIINCVTDNQETLDYCNSLIKSHDNVIVKVASSRDSYPELVNYAALVATGEYYLILNSNVEIVSENFIETMLGYFDQREVGIVAPRIIDVTEGRYITRDFIGPFETQIPANNFPKYGLNCFTREEFPQNPYVVSSDCQLIKKEVYEAVRGYNRTLKTKISDIDFCLATLSLGYRSVYTPYAQLVRHKSQQTINPKTAFNEDSGDLLELCNKWPEYFNGTDPYLNLNLGFPANPAK